MLRKILMIIFIISLSTQAQATEKNGKTYFALAGDYLMGTTGNLGAQAALGYQLFDSFALEAEAAYQNANVSDYPTINSDLTGFIYQDKDVNLFSFMINAVFTIDSGTMISPYFGLGAGITRNSNFDNQEKGLAYQAKAGINIDVSSEATLFLGYRYFSTYDQKHYIYYNGLTSSGSHLVDEISTSSVEIGYRYYF